MEFVGGESEARLGLGFRSGGRGFCPSWGCHGVAGLLRVVVVCGLK